MEHKKRKLLFWVLIAGLCFVAVLVILYACLAFMPTGYEEVAKSIEPAQKTISQLARPRIDKVPNATKTDAPMGSVAKSNSLPTERFGPPHRLGFYEELLSYEAGWLVKNPRIEKCDSNVVGYVQHLENMNIYSFMMWEAVHPLPNGASVISSMDTDQRVLFMREIKSIISARWRNMVSGPNGYECRKDSIHHSAEANEFLDQLDEFLLRPEWDLTPPTAAIEWPSISKFHYLALMTVIRASLRGDQAKAIRLLDRYFEAIRLMRLFYLLNPDVVGRRPSFDMTILGLNLAALPDFPASGWDHVMKGIQSWGISQEEETGIRRIRAAARRDRLMQTLSASQFETKSNSWHYFGGGIPESVLNQALSPIAARQIDRMAMHEWNRDYKGYLLQGDVLRRIFKAMNISGVKDLNLDTRSLGFNVQPLSIVDELENDLLCLQGARQFNRQRDTLTIERFPKFMFETIPPNPYDDKETRWLKITGYSKDSPLGRFHLKNKHAPETAQEVDAVLREAGPGSDLRGRLKWFNTQNLIVIWNELSKTEMRRQGGGIQGRKPMNIEIRAYPTDVLLIDEIKKVLIGRKGAQGT